MKGVVGARQAWRKLRAAIRSPLLRLLAAAVWIAGVAALMGFRANVTRSYPLGLYLVDRPTALRRGAAVIACLPEGWGRFARERGILGPGFCPGGVRAIGKMVLAVAGDTVELRPSGLTVNGYSVRHSRVWSDDHLGRPMPHRPWGSYVLDAEQLWLYSPYHPRAFDSRYYGPLRQSAVSAVIRPIWTAASAR